MYPLRFLLLVFFVFATVFGLSNAVNANEIRVFPTIADPSGTCAAAALGAGGACDLIRVLAGLAPISGPDAGTPANPGDTIIIAPGVYNIGVFAAGAPANGTGPAVIPTTTAAPFCAAPVAGCFGSGQIMEGLTVRSRDGAEVTVINGNAADPVFIIAANNVTLGGEREDQGLTIQNAVTEAGILIGEPNGGANPYLPTFLSGADGASEDITLQNLFVQNNFLSGVIVRFSRAVGPRSIENYRFLNNEFRRNGALGGPVAVFDDGISFFSDVGDIGGSSEDEGVHFVGNTFDSNFNHGVGFRNSGDQERLIFRNNYAVRNGANGFYWRSDVRQLEDIEFRGNIIMQNGVTANGTTNCPVFCSGMTFSNSGQLENIYFIKNRSEDFQQGITGNTGSGILFASRLAFTTPAPGQFPGPGGGVTDLDGVYFHDNVISQNGDKMAALVAGVNGGFPATGLDCCVAGVVASTPFDGITFVNNGDLNEVEFRHNYVLQNAGSGITVGLPGNNTCGVPGPPCFTGFAHPGDFEDILIDSNIIRNNGTHILDLALGAVPLYPHGDGFAVFAFNDVTNFIFRDNTAMENFNNGVFLGSVGNDITNARFFNNTFSKNGLQAVGAVGRPAGDGLEISSFGDINDLIWEGGEASDNGGSGVVLDANANTLASPNYGSAFLPAANAAALVGPNLADIDNIQISSSETSRNGASAPIGSGNGVLVIADKVSNVAVFEQVASLNDDHGFLFSSVDDMNDVTIKDTTVENNDRNRDSIGSGVYFDSTDDMDDSGVENVIANGNHVGVRFDVKGENGRSLSVINSVANDNDEEGIKVDGSDDLSDVTLMGNTLYRNKIGLTIRATDRGDNLIVTENNIKGGDNDSGIGALLQATGTTVNNNSIRNTRVGVKAERAFGNTITNNNIARNENFGIDALGLKPGETIDASNNWWGEPSGPDGPGNPNGLGDNITNKVNFEPWLGEPAVETDVNFQIVSFEVPEQANVGEIATIMATVRNNGTEEGSQSLNLKVECSEFIDSSNSSRTLNPATEVEITFNVVFPRGASCTATLSTQNDSQTATIEVLGSTGVTIESVCDANDNARIDDEEIMTCVGFWVTGEEVPGTGLTISDDKIAFLVELWVTNGDVSTLPASV